MNEDTNLSEAKKNAWYTDVYDKKDPLVTVCVPTYNQASLLVSRSLPSILNQSYTNLEIIVVGDHCTDQTEEFVNRLADPRIHFENLPHPSQYPSEPRQRWLVAGSIPMNRALTLASGDFITHLDDDDEFIVNRIALLVDYAQKTRADFIYHPFLYESYPDQWHINNAEALECNRVTTSAIFYHKWFKRIHWDPTCYMWNEPGDWNRIRRMITQDFFAARYPEPLTKHFMEGGNKHV